MTGYKPIVVRTQKARFHEHENVPTARVEARRLARLQPGEPFVIYVPIAVIECVDLTEQQTKYGALYQEGKKVVELENAMDEVVEK